VLRMEIPGEGVIEITDLVLDFNGTIAKDGHIHNKVKDTLHLLGKKVTLHVLTADTRGDVERATQRLPVTEALLASDVVFTSVLDALRFILKPLRHRATLRA